MDITRFVSRRAGRRGLGSLLAPVLALALGAGCAATGFAQDDNLFETDMVDTGIISEPNPALETDMVDPSRVSQDTDGDGLSDYDEATYGTDPLFADSDGDTLGDGLEFHQLGTFPWAWDTEGDDLGDGEELDYGTNPRSPDSDQDNFSDGFEVHSVGSDPTIDDTDGDGMLDGEDPRPLA